MKAGAPRRAPTSRSRPSRSRSASRRGLIAPLAKRFEDDYALSSTESAFLVAVPVVLGSLLRIPVGALTDRYGGRRPGG